MTHTQEEADAELDALYNPSISDLELDEHHGIDRPVVYLDSVKAAVQAHNARIKTEAERQVIKIAHQPCECGRDHFATPVRSVTGVVTSYCQFSRVVLSGESQLSPIQPEKGASDEMRKVW